MCFRIGPDREKHDSGTSGLYKARTTPTTMRIINYRQYLWASEFVRRLPGNLRSFIWIKFEFHEVVCGPEVPSVLQQNPAVQSVQKHLRLDLAFRMCVLVTFFVISFRYLPDSLFKPVSLSHSGLLLKNPRS